MSILLIWNLLAAKRTCTVVPCGLLDCKLAETTSEVRNGQSILSLCADGIWHTQDTLREGRCAIPSYSNKFPPSSLSSPGEIAYLFGIPGTAALLLATDGLVRTNGVVLATTQAAHNFIPGQPVDIVGPASDSGLSFPYGFDGSYVILTVPSTTTFTYLDPQKPNDQGDGGSAVSVAAETVTGLESSSQVALPPILGQPGPGVVVGLWFTVSPASGSIKIQEAQDDVDAGYVTPTGSAYTVTLTVPSYYESDLIPFGSRLLRLNVATVPGAGNMLARVLRVQ